MWFLGAKCLGSEVSGNYVDSAGKYQVHEQSSKRKINTLTYVNLGHAKDSDHRNKPNMIYVREKWNQTN